VKTVAKIVSYVSLVGTIVPPILFFAGTMTLDMMKIWMTATTATWFVATPFWME
jgi:hypothetical protein